MLFRLNQVTKICTYLLAGAATVCASQSVYAIQDWKRTVVFVQAETQSGQDMFIRGGLDHGQAAALGRNCTSTNMNCAMPIRHRNLLNTTTAPWKQNDNYLDWYGAEAGQTGADGTAADWTTNLWPSSWGAFRSVPVNGFGQEVLNTWGHHYWMLDVDMDCSKTINGWFELKTYVRNGQGWEGNIAQAGPPYPSNNHFAQCGKVNKFISNNSAAQFIDLKWNGEQVDIGNYRIIGTDGKNVILGTGFANTIQVWQPSNNGQWNKTTITAPSSAKFDGAVDIYGNYLVATSGTNTLVYKKTNGVWSSISSLSNTSAWTSYKRNASIDNNLIALGKPTSDGNAAVVNVYSILSNGSIVLESTIQTPFTGNIANFGKEVVLSGNYLAIASDQAAYVYERSSGGSWDQVQAIDISSLQTLASLDIKVMSENGPVILAIAGRGNNSVNTVYLYEASAGSWSQIGALTSAANSWSSQGRQVSLDQNGYLSYITDPSIDMLQVNVYKRNTVGTWNLKETIKPSTAGSWLSFPSHMVMVNPDTILMSETLAGPGVLYKIQK